MLEHLPSYYLTCYFALGIIHMHYISHTLCVC